MVSSTDSEKASEAEWTSVGSAAVEISVDSTGGSMGSWVELTSIRSEVNLMSIGCDARLSSDGIEGELTVVSSS